MKMPWPLFLLLALIGSCTAPSGEITMHVWKVRFPEQQVKLYINDKDKGIIPAVSSRPGCGDPGIDSTLTIKLPHGIYRIKAVNEKGQTISEGEMNISGNDLQLKGISGGMDARQNMDCVSLGIL